MARLLVRLRLLRPLQQALTAGHPDLIRAHARLGEVNRAPKAYQYAAQSMREELGNLPGPQTEWLATRLPRGEAV